MQDFAWPLFSYYLHEKNFRAAFRYNDIPLSRYSDLFEIISLGKMGSMGNLGLMGSEITKN